MKNFYIAILIILGLSCKKQGQKDDTNGNDTPKKCGTVLTTPVLDSFVYPTYYITTTVAFPDGDQTVHWHDNVTGEHDGSWFLPKYSVDSTMCITP